MASYQLLLERKRKFKEMALGYKFVAKLYWGYLKDRWKPKKLFHEVIIKDIHKALESGQKEIRYYLYSGNELYESLEDEHSVFKGDYKNGDDMKYSEDLYLFVASAVQQSFVKYNDLDFICKDAELCSYFSIKTKF